MAVKPKAAAKTGRDGKEVVESLGKMIKTFGDAMSEIFEDPDLRKKAKEFSQSVMDSAAKVVEGKLKSAQAKKKFRDAGRAARSLGETLVEHFDTE